MTATGMVERLAKRCGQGLVDVRLFSVELGTVVVERPKGRVKEWGSGKASSPLSRPTRRQRLSICSLFAFPQSPHLPSLSTPLLNLTYSDVGLSPIHQLYRWPECSPLLPSTPTFYPAQRDHLIHLRLNFASYLSSSIRLATRRHPRSSRRVLQAVMGRARDGGGVGEREDV